MSFKKQTQTRTPLFQRIILILFGMLLSVIFLEGALRFGGFAFSAVQEYRNRISISRKGAYRIMCLGESTTAGEYPRFLEEALEQSGLGIKFSVIDKGIPATRTGIILSMLESNLDFYQPNMVITMMGVNDGGSHMPREFFCESQFLNFLKSCRVYKLIQLLGLHIEAKFVELSGARRSLQEDKKTAKDLTEKEEGAFQSRDSKALIESGNIYRARGEFLEAEEQYRRALELDPHSDLAYTELAHLCYLQKKFPEMKDLFEIALRLNPENDRAYRELGYFFREQGQWSESEECYKKALAVDPQNPRSYIGLGSVYHATHRFLEAEKQYKKAQALQPENDKIYGMLAVLYQEMGNPELASLFNRQAKQLRERSYDLRFDALDARENYRELKKALDRRGITYVCVQYPMRDLDSLKKIFGGDTSGIIFVGNDQVFRDAVRESGYRAYFRDMFAGDFGHCTEKGNRLLAKNIARVILKEKFGYQNEAS